MKSETKQDRTYFSVKNAHVICLSSMRMELETFYSQNLWLYDHHIRCPGTLQKRGRKPVLITQLGGFACLIKRYYHGGVIAPLTADRFIGHARLLNALRSADYLAENNIETPGYVFVTWRRMSCWSKYESGTVLYSDGVDAAEYFFGVSKGEEINKGLIDLGTRAGSFIRTLHDVNFYHPDLNLMNLYIRSNHQFAILDLDKSSPPEGTISNKLKRKNLERLFRSVRKLGKNHSKHYVESLVQAIRTGYRDA